MKKLCCLILGCWFSLFAFSAENCPLSNSESPLDKLSEHLDEILGEIENLSSGGECYLENKWTGSYLIRAKAYGAATDLNIYHTNTLFYLDTSNNPLLKILYDHEKKIYDMLTDILETAGYVGQHCAEGEVVKSDISQNDSGYDPTGGSLENVIANLYKQTSHVLAYYRYLVTQKNNKYQDSVAEFPFVYKDFNQGMERFYRSKNIQECQNDEERNKRMDKGIGEAVSLAEKIILTLDSWWTSFKKLVLPDIDDPYKELGLEEKKKKTNIDELFFYPNGFGDSPYFINKGERRTGGNNPGNENNKENTKKSTSDRASFAETATDKNPQQLLETIYQRFKELGSESAISIDMIQNLNEDALILHTINKYHLSDYLERELLIEENSGQNPQTVVGLIRAIELLDVTKPVVENVWTLACNGYDRQATNLSEHQTCEELTNSQDSEGD